jgi:hypothetical protein
VQSSLVDWFVVFPLTSEEVECGLQVSEHIRTQVILTKVCMSPISSPLVPWILVPLSHFASVTDHE